MNTKTPKPPLHLQAPGQALWRDVHDQFVLEPHHVVILTAACVAADRAEQARLVIEAEGLTAMDARGGTRAHPCVGIERDSKNMVLRALRELALDAPGAAEASRPPQIAGGRRYG